MKKYRGIVLPILITIGFCYLSLYYFVFRLGKTLSDSGSMGDAFAGLTAPIINLLSVVLIYLSFRQQYEANELQKEALKNEIQRSNNLKELDQILDLIKDVKEHINKLKGYFIVYDDYGNHGTEMLNGEDTLYVYNTSPSEESFRKHITEISKIVDLLSFVCDKTESYKFELRDERVIFEKISLIYTEDFKDALTNISSTTTYPENDKINLPRELTKFHLQRIGKYHSHFIKRSEENIEKKMEQGINDLI